MAPGARAVLLEGRLLELLREAPRSRREWALRPFDSVQGDV